MKKIKLLIVPIISAMLIAGCAPSPEENAAPSLVGVKDIQCIVHSTVDFLDGVAALDREDGDITPALEITVSPEVEVAKEGFAVFTETGEYEVTYKIEDSAGNVTEKTAFVDVIERELDYSFVQPGGFSVNVGGNASVESSTIKRSGMASGEYTFKATGGKFAEDIKLTHTYTLCTNSQYEFEYSVNSNVAGKIKVLADGKDCAELQVANGDNSLKFTHTARSEGDGMRNVQIDLCLGGLGEEINWKVTNVSTSHLHADTTNVKFNGNSIERRIDNDNGNLGVAGDTAASADGKSATLEITETCDDMWRGGMFINTGVYLQEGNTYNVSFKVKAQQANYFQVLIQRNKWEERVITTVDNRLENGKQVKEIAVNKEILVTGETAGELWLYVQSGTEKNKITISDLSVCHSYEKYENIALDFTHNNHPDCKLETENGGFKYTVANFEEKDDAQQVTSPVFFVGGSAKNYVITFKAKASAPVEFIFTSPISGGWDPTLMWTRTTLSEEEKVYTFFCTGSGMDNLHYLVWQFGSAANQRYSDVTIEISDIKISYKNTELDG